jgi:hypothetical protein
VSYVRPNYHKPGFPVLGYHYALYCDDVFAENEFKRWRDAGGRNGNYRGNLTPYVADERPFPAESEGLANVEVAAGGVQETCTLEGETAPSVRYRPTWLMGARQAIHLIRELTGEPATAGWRRTPQDDCASTACSPSLNAKCPLLSTLAVMYLANDKQAWSTYDFGWSVKDLLGRLAAGESLTAEQLQPFVPVLADEFSQPPARW